MNLAPNHSEDSELDIENSSLCTDLLEKLILPNGVSAEILAKVITACILKKAFFVQSAWSKWILLAGLNELLGTPCPMLSAQQVKQLQEDSINHFPLDSSVENMETSKNSDKDVNIRTFVTEDESQADKSDKSLDAAIPLADVTENSEISILSSSQSPNKNNNNIKYPNQRKCERLRRFNVGTQCNSKKLGLTANKKTQTSNIGSNCVSCQIKAERSLFNISSVTQTVVCSTNSFLSKAEAEMIKIEGISTQTDSISVRDNFTCTDSLSMRDNFTCTDSISMRDNFTCTDSISMRDNFTCSDSISMKDNSTSTSSKSKRANLPHTYSKSMRANFIYTDSKSMRNSLTHTSKPTRRRAIETDSKSIRDNVCHTYQTWKLVKISGLKRKRKLDLNDRKVTFNSFGKSIKMFHSKPLIDSDSKLIPHPIPLDPVGLFLNAPVLYDPRLSNSSSEEWLNPSYVSEGNGSVSDLNSYENHNGSFPDTLNSIDVQNCSNSSIISATPESFSNIEVINIDV